MTVLSAISHVLYTTSIPVNQPPGEVLTEVGFWLKLSTRHIVSSALSMVYMLPKCHGLIPAVDLQKTLILLLHGLHHICLGVLSHIL